MPRTAHIKTAADWRALAAECRESQRRFQRRSDASAKWADAYEKQALTAEAAEADTASLRGAC